MTSGTANLVDALAELARQVRASTLQLLHVPTTEQLTWTPSGTSNHILWHAGHALWVQDALTVEPLTGRSELPRGWAASFGQDSNPATIAEWPSDVEVRGRLETQLSRVLDLFSQHRETISLHANEMSDQSGWPLLAGIIHGWHDEARHHGEMYLLHKLCRIMRD